MLSNLTVEFEESIDINSHVLEERLASCSSADLGQIIKTGDPDPECSCQPICLVPHRCFGSETLKASEKDKDSPQWLHECLGDKNN